MSARLEEMRGGAVARVVLDRPKANILDTEMVRAIRSHLQELTTWRALKLVLFEGAGKHFSFGASVEEHLPDTVDAMLRTFHFLFDDLEALGTPTAAAVTGQCLGGAAELACWCGFVAAAPGARIGFPEIKLGVFPPIAALSLRWRVPGAAASRMVITGASVSGQRAAQVGLADVCDEDPHKAVMAWYDEHLAPLSAVSVRAAWRASRRPIAAQLRDELPQLERLYLHDLMSLNDPLEGLNAFIEKRPPAWRHE